MFCRVMSDPAICAEMIRRLLHIPVGRVEQVQPQKGVRIHADARGVRFDVYVRDADRVYDVEIQVADEGNLPLRARYYQSALDLDMLKAGEAVGRLKESWIVFLCLFDPFRLGEAVYTVRKTFAEKEGRRILTVRTRCSSIAGRMRRLWMRGCGISWRTLRAGKQGTDLRRNWSGVWSRRGGMRPGGGNT